MADKPDTIPSNPDRAWAEFSQKLREMQQTIDEIHDTVDRLARINGVPVLPRPERPADDAP